jgi:hypothetical protein
MNSVAYSLLLMLRSSFRTRARMQIEILALRHQLAVLQRQGKRVSLGAAETVCFGYCFHVFGINGAQRW